MEKHKFNHDAENIDEAVGINSDDLQTKIDKLVSDELDDSGEITRSKAVEVLSKGLTAVELAYALDIATMTIERLGKIIENTEDETTG